LQNGKLVRDELIYSIYPNIAKMNLFLLKAKKEKEALEPL